MLALLGLLPVAGKVIGKVVGAVIDFASTAFGAAILAALLTYGVTKHVTAKRVNAEWTQKWKAAEAKAEIDRLERDANIRNQIARSVATRISSLEQNETVLTEKVKAYETELAKAGPAGACILNPADERRLRDLGRRDQVSQPKAKSGLAARLQAIGKARSGAGAESR